MDPHIEHGLTDGVQAHAASMRFCTHCGAEAEASWAFCGDCGMPLNHLAAAADYATPVRTEGENRETEDWTALVLADPTQDVEPLNGSARPPRQRPALVALYMIGAFAVLALIAGAGYQYLQVRDDLEQTRTELTATERQLDTTRSTLADTQESLASSNDELDKITGELQQTTNRLRAARRELSGLEGSLNNAQNRLDLQANQIETLRTCLDGVTSALSYVAYSNYSAAIAALDAVEISCNRAYDLL